MQFVEQISRMTLVEEMTSTDDTGNDQAMDGLIRRARAMLAEAAR
ncbi:hypothetical protein HMP06_0469 [Sphingomonas sp. HMP6]|nr:hypothetical protein HMP06_0469 [Sphingomonas sp. HMP6]